jgi:hypothetical protein
MPKFTPLFQRNVMDAQLVYSTLYKHLKNCMLTFENIVKATSQTKYHWGKDGKRYENDK